MLCTFTSASPAEQRQLLADQKAPLTTSSLHITHHTTLLSHLINPLQLRSIPTALYGASTHISAVCYAPILTQTNMVVAQVSCATCAPLLLY
jgi:hypothetical protein